MSEKTDPAEILLVDKPLRWTSFDVVKKIRGHFRLKKVGHAGTLDPLATGLLIVCTGKKTKEIQFIMDEEKEYTGTLVLGKTTPSYDLETEIQNEKDISHITEQLVHDASKKFSGWIDQIPPQHSAIRVKGKRAYESARKGKTVVLEPRKVEIKQMELMPRLPEVDFRIICSKGTYIRSLVRDIGEELGVGAYLSALRRTRIGKYAINDARTIEELTTNESL